MEQAEELIVQFTHWQEQKYKLLEKELVENYSAFKMKMCELNKK